jgi:LmbE family N-acetylglucosaminyl deacetylase
MATSRTLARDRLAFPEQLDDGLAPHAVDTAWLFSTDQPNTVVEIADTLGRKIEARLSHASQTADASALRRSWRERAVRIGAAAGVGPAEAFHIVRLG